MSYVMRLMAIEDRILRVIGSDSSGGGPPSSDFIVDLGTCYMLGIVDINPSSFFNTDKTVVRRSVTIHDDTVRREWSFKCSPSCTLKASYGSLQQCHESKWDVGLIAYKFDPERISFVTIKVNSSEYLNFYKL